MSMTREDVLRELELLPVWQLRAPLKLVELPTDLPAKAAPIVEVAIEAARVELIVSDDKKWIFAYPADRMDIGLQSILFKNILLALKITKTNTMPLENLADSGASVIIAMGETVAQQLLNSTESLEMLRGKTHVYENIPLIVTYHPSDMLQHLPNKAKTWDDLCMVFQLLNA
jgi:uracil-DNA glycosylase